MEISTEIIDFFNDRRTRAGKLDRNVELFLHYYGFLSADWPIYDELVGDDFDVNNKARVGQILDLDFAKIEATGGQPFSSLQDVVGILRSSSCMMSSVFVSRLAANGLANPADCNPMGIIRLLYDLKYCDNYAVLGLDLRRIPRRKYSRSKPYLIIDTNSDVLTRLNEGLDQAKDLSADFGLVSFSLLNDTLGKSYSCADIIGEIIIANAENTIFKDDQKETYFHIGGFKKDGFLTSLAKIFGVANKVHITELTEAMRRPIAKRQGKKTAIRLPLPVIRKFIEVFPYLREEGDSVYFSGKIQSLGGIELAASKFLRAHGSATFTEFREHLTTLGFGINNIKIVAYHSPVINVNKANGFGHYQFSLVGQGDWRELASPEEIQIEIGDNEDFPDEHRDEGTNDDGKMTREEFEQSLEEAKKTGELGEKLVNSYLTKCKDCGSLLDFRWESKIHPNASYDFWLSELSGIGSYVDAKSTRGEFNTELHISLSELYKMRVVERYFIYRVYELTDISAKLRVSENMSELATQILKYSDGFPAGIVPDGILLKPAVIKFSEEMSLTA